MDPKDLPTVTNRATYPSLKYLRQWWGKLGEDTTFQDDVDHEVALPESRSSGRPMPSFAKLSTTDSAKLSGKSLDRPSLLRRTDALPRKSKTHHTAVLQTSAADRFLGTAASIGRAREQLPRFIVHPLDIRYRTWWYVTVVVAAITALLEPYVIAFTDPGLYPYNSASSIVEYTCIALIAIDMVISFNVARYVNGELVTSRRQLARNYFKLIFWVDLLSVIPFDEMALAMAGLNGPLYVNNPLLAQYLSLFKLVRMLRMYRLSWFFSYLTYNLASPLLLVTLLRNLASAFFFANLSACAWYFEALQSGLGPDTWVGANAAWFDGATTGQMYIYSLYWSIVTLTTTGYGDIHAYNPVEAGLIAFWLLFVFFYTAYIIGSITLLVVKGDERAGKYREEMQALQGYATLHALPPELRDSMQRHLKLHFYNADAADENVLRVYPSSIRRRVLRQLYLETLQRVYLFCESKPRFLDALLGVCRVELYLPQVDVVSEGDFVAELFVVVAGSVVSRIIPGPENNNLHRSSVIEGLRTNDESSLGYGSQLTVNNPSEYLDISVHGGSFGPSRILQEGDVFGEVAFFTGTAQLERVTTLKTCRILAISRAAYDKVAATFPTSARLVLTQLARYAEEATLDEFPGPSGVDAYHKAVAAGMQAEAAEFMAGEDPTWRLPASQVAALRLTARQEAAVGSLLQVKGVVFRAVAKHDEDRTNEWLNAAARGDLAKIREMVGHNIDPNTSDYDSRTALMLAASRGFLDVVDMLLRVGADPNTADTFGCTALWEACKSGHDDCIEALLAKGAKLGRASLQMAGLLCNAVFEGDLKLLRRLLHAGADPNEGDYDGRTPLHIAAAEGNVPAVEMLVVEGKADPAKRDRWGSTAHDEAIRVGARAVEMFLAAEEEAQTERRASRLDKKAA